MKRLLSLTLSLFLLISLFGQTSLTIPRNVSKAYKEGTRDMSGTPGRNYWQNFAEYDIQIRFDPLTRVISGSETIAYSNNSPDTLRMLVFKLFPNYYSKGVSRVRGIDTLDVSPEVKITNLKIQGNSSQPRMMGTNMIVPVKGIYPSKSVNVSLDFSFRLNKGSYNRTGESDEGAWFIAYFFPRIAVYDDIDGWDLNRYLGLVEFYNDFSDFKLSVTVPKNYVVWATGTLTNPDDVLSPVYRKRLAEAEKTDKVISIIDSTDIRKGNITAGEPFNTFKFEAKNVTDVAAAISNHYMWRSSSVLVDSSSGRRTRVDAVFDQQKEDFFEVAEFARKTVISMSYYFPKWPYPYQHETIFNSEKTQDGMEYPMMVSDGNFPLRNFTIDVTLHEIFHTMFPFYTGLNETKYGWMDEGLAMLSNWVLMPTIESSEKSFLFPLMVDQYAGMAGNESDVPIMTLSYQQDEQAYIPNSYIKPAMALLYLRDMVGEDLFLKGLQQFIRSWNGKHPIPYDFFNSMNHGTGMNLDWYWKKWYFEGGAPDLAITGLTSDKKTSSVRVEMKGEKPLPVDLTVTFNDGTKQKVHRSAGVWEEGRKVAEVKIPGSKSIKEITLGSEIIPDINPKDNHWPAN